MCILRTRCGPEAASPGASPKGASLRETDLFNLIASPVEERGHQRTAKVHLEEKRAVQTHSRHRDHQYRAMLVPVRYNLFFCSPNSVTLTSASLHSCGGQKPLVSWQGGREEKKTPREKGDFVTLSNCRLPP